MNTPDLPEQTLRMLTNLFSEYPELTEVILYGSRAIGKAKTNSDIDLATVGIIDPYRLGRLALDLEDMPIPQECDLTGYEGIKYAPFKRHIDNFGITIYGKGT